MYTTMASGNKKAINRDQEMDSDRGLPRLRVSIKTQMAAPPKRASKEKLAIIARLVDETKHSHPFFLLVLQHFNDRNYLARDKTFVIDKMIDEIDKDLPY